MQQKNYEIFFESLDELSWLSVICMEHHRNICDENVSVYLHVDVSLLKPLHVTTLACFIQFLLDNGNIVIVDKIGKERNVCELLSFTKNVTSAPVLDLWRIEDSRKDSHTIQIYNYLKSLVCLKGKDLSAVRISLVEAYANVFDHAQANGNAYSFISFDEREKKIGVAVCDFGIGIPKTIASSIRVPVVDSIAIVNAMENGISSKSQNHNRGFGLANIRSACTEADSFCVISRSGKVVAKALEESICINSFDFPGTLLSYEISLDNYEDEELINEFEF